MLQQPEMCHHVKEEVGKSTSNSLSSSPDLWSMPHADETPWEARGQGRMRMVCRSDFLGTSNLEDEENELRVGYSEEAEWTLSKIRFGC